MVIKKLEAMLSKSWSANTSSIATWTPANLSERQCAVTALIVQDYFGGEVVKTHAITAADYIQLLQSD